LSNKYRKVSLTMVVGADATDQISRELEEAAYLIAMDNLVYEYSIDEKRSRRPENAVLRESSV
jgi:hypothetical protein